MGNNKEAFIMVGIFGVLIISMIIYGFMNSGLSDDEASEAVFEISGFTADVKTQIVPGSKEIEYLEEKFGVLNIPSTVLKYDIVQFKKINLKKNETNSLKILIHGEEYDMVLERMGFEEIDDGIDSYSGFVKGLDNSIALFTFSEIANRSLVLGSIDLEYETIFIDTVQNRENAMKTEMPLHIVYSSNDVEKRWFFGI